MSANEVVPYPQASEQGCYVANAAFANTWLSGSRIEPAAIEQEIERDSTAKIAALSIVRTQGWLLSRGYIFDEYPQAGNPIYEYMEKECSWENMLGKIAVLRDEPLEKITPYYDKSWIDDFKSVYPLQKDILQTQGEGRYQRHEEQLTPEKLVAILHAGNIAIGAHNLDHGQDYYHAVSIFKPMDGLMSLYYPGLGESYISELGVADNLPYAIDFHEPIEIWSRATD